MSEGMDLLKLEYKKRVLNWEKAFKQNPTFVEAALSAIEIHSASKDQQIKDLTEKYGWLNNKVEELLLFCKEDGECLNGFRTMDIIKELRTRVQKDSNGKKM